MRCADDGLWRGPRLPNMSFVLGGRYTLRWVRELRVMTYLGDNGTEAVWRDEGVWHPLRNRADHDC
jgi:hypothetical protein